MKTLFERRIYFNKYLPKLEGADNRNDIKDLANTCPACGFPSLEKRCSWEICIICFWEDDGQDDPDADEIWGGPNSDYSLTEYRQEWEQLFVALKVESSEIGNCLNQIDELIQLDDASVLTEIRNLLEKIEQHFCTERGLAAYLSDR